MAKILLFSLGLVLSLSGALAGEISADEEHTMGFGSWKFPAEFPLSRIEKLVQLAADAMYGRGFRYLGDPHDWDHGHLLFEARPTAEGHVLIPRAILYHTQENAHHAHWDDLDKKFDYVDVRARNWIQWLSEDAHDGEKVENARVYLNPSRKDPAPFFGENDPQPTQRYTINQADLDGKKLGFQVYGNLEFFFAPSNCEDENSLFTRGPIRVRVAGQTESCLKVSTTVYFLPVESK